MTQTNQLDKRALESKLRAFLEAEYRWSSGRYDGLELTELVSRLWGRRREISSSDLAFSDEEITYLKRALEALDKSELALRVFLDGKEPISREDAGFLIRLRSFIEKQLRGKVSTMGKSIKELIGVILDNNLLYWNPRYFPKEEIARIDEIRDKRKKEQV